MLKKYCLRLQSYSLATNGAIPKSGESGCDGMLKYQNRSIVRLENHG